VLVSEIAWGRGVHAVASLGSVVHGPVAVLIASSWHAAFSGQIRGKTWGEGEESGGNKFGPYGPGSSWQSTRTGEVELPR
jgi:hypothetical protein